MQAIWIFATLISHWRRHPLNFATLFIGLAIATALWSGVQALNQQARASYDRAAAVFGDVGAASIVSATSAYLSDADFVGLRRAGWNVSPVLEGTVRIGAASLRLIGIDPLSAPKRSAVAGITTGADLKSFILSPGQALVALETLSELGLKAGDRPATERGHNLPPLVASAEVAPGLIIVDIGIAQHLLDRRGALSRLVTDAVDRHDADALAAASDKRLRFGNSPGGDLARLTDSFHLNLTAFGFLAFIVGLFIVHASIGLAFEQRLPTIRTMRAIGVPLQALIALLVIEVVLFAVIAGVAGMIVGYVIAAALLPDVAASLDGLYGAHVGGTLAIEPRWWLSGLGMALAGALAASALSLTKVARMPALSVAKPLAWREMQHHQLRRQAILAVLFFVMAGAAYLHGAGLVGGFVVIAGVLLGSALLLPTLLAQLLRFGEGTAKTALATWVWADTRQQLSGLSLALMALLLALSANIGVGTMVEGFRKTFTGWLDERLNSEIYFDAASNDDAVRISQWLEHRPDVQAVLPVWRADTRIDDWPIDLVGTRDHATYREHFTLLSHSDAVWDKVRDGSGVLISEQLSRRLGKRLGDKLVLPGSNEALTAEIVGIYPDYGNPKGQVRLDVRQLTAHWPEARRTSFSLRVAAQNAAPLMAAMQSEFGPALARIVDQAAIKALSTRIFEKTFAVTAALNTLTLMVSGVALFASLLTLSGMRLAQLAPVWAIGIPRRQLAGLEVGKLLVLAAITSVLAVPLGLALAWCLVSIVNVQAFGWLLPFHIFAGQWVVVGALALVTAFVAALVPVVRLSRVAPQDLLRVFANER